MERIVAPAKPVPRTTCAATIGDGAKHRHDKVRIRLRLTDRSRSDGRLYPGRTPRARPFSGPRGSRRRRPGIPINTTRHLLPQHNGASLPSCSAMERGPKARGGAHTALHLPKRHGLSRAHLVTLRDEMLVDEDVISTVAVFHEQAVALV